MNTLLIYETQYGNTEQIAERIASRLEKAGRVRSVPLSEAGKPYFGGINLVVLGCPTQMHGLSKAMREFVTAMTDLDRVRLAVFDTRYKMPRWVTGSAAQVMGDYIQDHGGILALPPESFFVMQPQGPLVAGELSRAEQWGESIIEAVKLIAA